MANGKSNPVPLIIFIVLFVFSTTGLVLVAIELSKARKQMDEGFNRTARGAQKIDETMGLKRKYQESQLRIHDLEETLDVYRKVTGVANRDDLKQELKNITDRVLKVRDGRGEATAAPAKNLVSLVLLLEQEKIRLQKEIDDLAAAAKRTETTLRNRLTAEETAVAEKQAAIVERDDQIEKLKDAAAEERMIATRVKAEQTAALERTRQKLDEQRADLMEKVRILEAQVQDLLAQLDRLRREKGVLAGKPKDFEPTVEPADGKVILVDREAGVILDVGRKKGIRRGLRFDVYLQKADGTRVKRGEIEVKTVFPEISRAVLVKGGYPTEFIYKNDIIVNPAFDPGRAKVFVADTTFDAAKKQSFRDALSEYGSVLEDDLSVLTDYLIVGTQKGNLVEQAQKLGVIIIRENDLNAFLGR